jgi:2-keto-3-deoxy-L-rhamnonate aldolase RhmA
VLLRQARTVDVCPALATAGVDWLFIDLEHSTMPLDTAMQLSVAGQAAGLSPLVRVPPGQYEMATRVLDGGAMGIIMPHVDTPAQAKELADRLRFPPRGVRSVGGPMAQLGFRSLPLADATAAVDAGIMLVAMIETREAIANVDAIAAVDGINVLLIGTNDLSMDLGLPGQLMHSDIQAGYRAVGAACAKHGKVFAMGGVYTAEGIETYMKLGVRMILLGSDLGFLMAGAREMVGRIGTAAAL